ncbi:MAG: endonuclease III [Candidatus Paceibacterota bacterium]
MKKTPSEEIAKKRAQYVNKELKKLFPDSLQTPLHFSTDIELLVAVILSAQTTDKGVNALTSSLFTKYTHAKEYVHTPLPLLEKDLATINYFRTKARHIQRAMSIISEKHDGEVPGSMSELLELPGVGRKTANVVLGHLFGIVEGIAVDTHVVRLSNKFGLVRGRDPHKIERELMRLLPQKDWWEFSYRIKAYGREISPARRGLDDPISLKLIEKGLLPRVRISCTQTKP